MAAARRGIDLFRFNTEDYPMRVGVAADPLAPDDVVLLSETGEIALGRARGIWIRRPQWPEIAETVEDPLDRLFASQEAIAAMGGVWRLLADRCVSPPDALQAARWKLAQIAVAHDVGLSVPATLVATDAERARQFITAGPTVMKAVAEARVRAGDAERIGSTVAINEEWDLDGIEATPVLLQRRVFKVADLRVTVVGRSPFAVRIVTPPDAPLDFRLTDPQVCRYEVVTLPEIVEAALLRYMQRWPLRFAAFDLAEDAHGQLWFLECNPAGQWAWLEPLTGLNITSQLIDLLLGPEGEDR